MLAIPAVENIYAVATRAYITMSWFKPSDGKVGSLEMVLQGCVVPKGFPAKPIKVLANKELTENPKNNHLSILIGIAWTAVKEVRKVGAVCDVPE